MKSRIGAAAWAAALVLCVSCTPAVAGVMLDPKPAPEWEVREWINGDPGPISRLRDKVVLVEFFQLWCPGCNSFSLPLFQRWHELYGERDDVVVLSIHSVFEGHDYQTDERLREFVQLNGIDRPVGIDAHGSPGDLVPVTMKRYAARGTPHVVIIGKDGKIRFSAFGSFAVEPVEAYIDRLLSEGQSAFASANVAAPVDVPDQLLSGEYTVAIEQMTKTCGPVLAPFTVQASVEVYPDSVQARFSEGYMDFNRLTLHFVPRTKGFQLRTRRRAVVKDGAVTLSVDIEGSFLDGVLPPEFEFRGTLEKQGDDPGWDCHVELRGRGRLNT